VGLDLARQGRRHTVGEPAGKVSVLGAQEWSAVVMSCLSGGRLGGLGDQGDPGREAGTGQDGAAS
jgi:hypothetical protein